MDAHDKDHMQREAVFGRLVGDHAQFLYRVAHSLLRHPQDAEDAVQDALLKLYRGESWRGLCAADHSGADAPLEVDGTRPVDGVRDERAYLARVVWRASLDRRAGRPVHAQDEEAGLRLADRRPSPELAASAQDERVLLHELIDALPEELRQPLLFSAMDELSSREIGAVMGLPEGTVRTRLMRARTRLKEAFESRCAREPVQAMGSK